MPRLIFKTFTTKIIIFAAIAITALAGGIVSRVVKSAGAKPPIIQPTSNKITLSNSSTNQAFIKLSDARQLGNQAEATGEQLSGQPLALASADFDEDGTPDLISSFGDAANGIIKFYRGNAEAIYPSSTTDPKTTLPFFPATKIFSLTAAPDFIAAGDFNADGHFDVVTAARNRNALIFLAGDGKGNFAEPQTIELSGQVTAMTAGEINRVDGLADLAIAVQAPEGAQVLVFASSEGAIRATPKSFAVSHAVSAMAFGLLSKDSYSDLAIAAGSDLYLLEGREQSPIVTRKAQNFSLQSLAIGRFSGGDHEELAMLTQDGSVYVTGDNAPLNRNRAGTSRAATNWSSRLLYSPTAKLEAQNSPQQLLRTRISTSPNDDLLLLDANSNQLQILTNNATPEISSASFASKDSLVAALPMRLNSSAQNGLVLLSSNNGMPAVVTPEAAQTFTVTSIADAPDTTPGDGICSARLVTGAPVGCTLRAAIQEANANAGKDTIIFNIGSGAQIINLFSALPNITEAVTIDGLPQLGAPASQAITVISVGQFCARGFEIQSGNSTIRGLTITGFCSSGIVLRTGGNNSITGNTIVSNGAYGIELIDSSANTIGGTSAAARNVISSNNYGGISVSNSGSTLNTIAGNYIGTDSTGTKAGGNGFDGGILILTANNNTIGGTTVGSRNVISGNQGGGIAIVGNNFVRGAFAEAADGNLVQGNLIGVDVVGSNALGNGTNLQSSFTDGIYIQSASTNTIGGTSLGAGNVIANNGDSGVYIGPQIVFGNTIIPAGVNNSILGNSIYANINLGIDLDAHGVAPNDPGDGDTGANNIQNFPVITSALTRTNGTTITGTLNSTISSTFTVELFSNTVCDSSGNGEGETFVGRATVVTNATGNGSFSVVVPAPIPAGRVITATATGASGTSEFSTCFAVRNAVADLAVTQTSIPDPVYVGFTQLYTITVANNGPDDATGIVLTDDFTIPNKSFTRVISATTAAPGGSCTGTGPITCTLGNLAPRTSTTVAIVLAPSIPEQGVIPPQSVTITNTASVVSREQDSNTQNNTSILSGTVRASADMSVTQTVSPNAVAAGGTITYSITVRNNGPVTAAPVSIDVTLPFQLSNITCTATNGGICLGQGNKYTATYAVFGTPATNTITLTGVLGCFSQNTVLTNLAVVRSTTFDPNNNNNSSTITSTGLAGAATAKITYDAGGTALTFGPAVAGGTATPPSATFTFENSGCLPMNLASGVFVRSGDVSKLAGLDDSLYYSLRLVNANGTETPLNPIVPADRNAAYVIPLNRILFAGQKLQFRVVFNPQLPFFAGKFSRSGLGINANQVLPDVVNSLLSFTYNSDVASTGFAEADQTASVTLTGRVSPAVQIISRDGFTLPVANAVEAQREASPLVIFDRLPGGNVRVAVSLYDANLNVTKISYQFVDTFGQLVGKPIEVPLTDVLVPSASGLLVGQAFTLAQSFLGLSGRPDVTSVRVTVTDGDGTTVTAASNPNAGFTAGFLASESRTTTTRDVLELPTIRLAPSDRNSRAEFQTRSKSQ